MLILNFIIILTLYIAVISQAHRAFPQGMGDWIICYLVPRCGCCECFLAYLQYAILALWLGIGTLYFLSQVTATVNMPELCAAHSLALQRKT